MNWDSELARRLESLKCPTCRGTNPYICKCAKAAWEEEEDWKNFKALVFPSELKKCAICKDGEYTAYCFCARESWRVWNRDVKQKEKEARTKKYKVDTGSK
jgi:hypothetical protein